MGDLGAEGGAVAGDEDGGGGEAVVDGVGLEVDVVERVGDVGGDLEAGLPRRERGEGRAVGVAEERGQRRRVREELVGEEERAVGRRGAPRSRAMAAWWQWPRAARRAATCAWSRRSGRRNTAAECPRREQRKEVELGARRWEEEKLAVAAASSWKVRRRGRSGRESRRAWSEAAVEEEVAVAVDGAEEEEVVEYWVAVARGDR